jgi:hypothetical protein
MSNFFWNSTLGASLMVCVVSSVAGCGSSTDAETGPARDEALMNDRPTLQANANLAQTLSLNLRTAERLTGSVARQGARATEFDALISDRVQGKLASVVRFGDDSLEWSVNQTTGEFWLDGHGMTVTAENVAGAKQLSAALEAKLTAEHESGAAIAPHEGLLFAEALWLSDARVGQTLAQHADTIGKAGKKLENAEAFGYTNDFPICIATGPRLAYMQRDSGARTTATLTVGGVGRHPNHAGNWNCLGECGEGCQAWWHNGHWIDCYEHDACVYFYPSADCDNAKIWAADDYAASVDGVIGLLCN